MTTEKLAAPRGLQRLVPILGWPPAYTRSWLLAALIAGLTLWGLVVAARGARGCT